MSELFKRFVEATGNLKTEMVGIRNFKYFIIIFVFVAALLFSRASDAGCGSPLKGYVPDAKTAIQVAKAILIAHYGENQIKQELPLRVTQKVNVWRIEGTLKKPWFGDTVMGGVAEIEISAIDGKVLNMCHGQ